MATNALLTRLKPLDFIAFKTAQQNDGTMTLNAAIAAMQGTLSYSCPQCVVGGNNTGVITLTPPGLIVVCPTCGGMCKTDVPYIQVGSNYIALVITGINSVISGGTLQLSATVTGGTWASGTTATATINTNSGLVTAVAAGATTITYTLGSVSVTAVITVTS
jgi:hypothetical protein